MKRNRLKRVLSYLYGTLILGGLLSIVTVLFCSAGFYLSSQAGIPEKADAVIALGGNGEARVARALDVFRQGHVKNVLIIRPIGKKERQQEFMRSGARKENIFFDLDSNNTYEEAVNSLKLMQARGWKHVLIVTDPPHMRRVSWTWRQVIRETGMTFTLVATSASWWNAEYWWRIKTSRDFVLSEYKKLLYYLLVYGTGLAAQPEKTGS
ncbi:MAG: YdcF family protein [Thermodesulfovibrio sp.]|nr:YdcF family protein [Thermodesulfovibrio sp.]